MVETQGRHWAWVPVLGSRAHIDWTAPDAAGRTVLFALRRVSRYEGLIRWAKGSAVPTLSRIYHLNSAQRKALTWKRRLQDQAEEPASLPVLVSPHPTRIEFVFALPNSGARSTVSGLSALRTGYRGLANLFGHKRIDDTAPTHEEILSKLSVDDRLANALEVINPTAGLQAWGVNLKKLPTVFLGLVVLSPQPEAGQIGDLVQPTRQRPENRQPEFHGTAVPAGGAGRTPRPSRCWPAIRRSMQIASRVRSARSRATQPACGSSNWQPTPTGLTRAWARSPARC